MTRPNLTFFCELDTAALQTFFSAPEVLDDLHSLGASISLGLLDLSPERAAVVRHLNEANIPVIAWLLLPRDQGYWLNLDNATQAADRYRAFAAWTAEEALVWDGIGLDIEPDIRLTEAVVQRNAIALPSVIFRALRGVRLRQGKKTYQRLAAEIRADGYRLDSYQFPLLLDERKAHTTALQRLTGIVDLPSDREVFLLYTSFLRPNGLGAMWSYGPEVNYIGVGATGGGVDLNIGDSRPLSWEELARDLRHAWRWCDDIHVFSLEGCVKQGFLKRLRRFDWDSPIMEPTVSIRRVDNWRATLQSALWLVNNLTLIVISGLTAGLIFVPLWRRWKSSKS